MRKLNQYETLLLDEFEDEKFHLPEHTHTYYELIYIRKGNGIHRLNDNLIPYVAGDLFAISPDDRHYFDIHESTRFVYIKFTDSYFSSKKNLATDEMLIHSPEEFMREKRLKENALRLDEPCAGILKNTVDNIVAYNCRKDVSTSPIVFYQILSIFGLIREAIGSEEKRDTTRCDNNQLIGYIHQHIYDPHRIQVKQIASEFHIAETYFGAYFRRNFGMSYREYVNNLRTKLLEKRIAGGNLSLQQIADEFGFADNSHLSNYFRKRKQLKPTDFARKQIGKRKN
ncbi:helix-turn-helix domain-containing protein [Flavobacterium silvaticum]|uniref:Helix-turn-helix domain-containing protein n=1 Tax=Flavobacterium silvaticum TaxID=1852020 RepID=A0A972FIX1_9FLAO|nr:AraC family transcriptional regulator [Flavobacterium silvaticum]NMH26859.1 helix-turn-helix domain-containing protein [Flavobacterium silvaticum]